MANVRLAIRTLIKTPFIAFVAILSLALGIRRNLGYLLAVQPAATSAASGSRASAPHQPRGSGA
jgi:hypothetical protein